MDVDERNTCLQVGPPAIDELVRQAAVVVQIELWFGRKRELAGRRRHRRSRLVAGTVGLERKPVVTRTSYPLALMKS